MGNDQIKVQAKISNIIISVIIVAAIILIILNFRPQKSALEKCADRGVLYISGASKMRLIITKVLKLKWKSLINLRTFLTKNFMKFAV